MGLARAFVEGGRQSDLILPGGGGSSGRWGWWGNGALDGEKAPDQVSRSESPGGSGGSGISLACQCEGWNLYFQHGAGIPSLPIPGQGRAWCCVAMIMDGLWSGSSNRAMEAAFPPFIESYYLCHGVGQVAAAPCEALGASNVAEPGLLGQRFGCGGWMHNRSEESWIRQGLHLYQLLSTTTVWDADWWSGR